jgi:hypothetical protein
MIRSFNGKTPQIAPGARVSEADYSVYADLARKHKEQGL